MQKKRKLSMTGSFAVVGVIAFLWFAISWGLSLMLAAAEDNLDMTATTPWLLKWACAIVFFPMRYLQRWDHISSTPLVMVGMLVNGVFWGFMFLFLYLFLTRMVEAK